MRIFRRKAQAVAPDTVETLSIDVDLMNEVFDRSAGRWCGPCGQHGSHHTEDHNGFAQMVLDASARVEQ